MFLSFSGITLGQRSIPARCLNNQNVDISFRKIGPSHQGLLQKIHIARVKDLFPFRSKENPRRSQNMT